MPVALHPDPRLTEPRPGPLDRLPAHAAADQGFLGPSDADRFVARYDEAVRTGRFTYAVSFLLTAGTLPREDGGPGRIPPSFA